MFNWCYPLYFTLALSLILAVDSRAVQAFPRICKALLYNRQDSARTIGDLNFHYTRRERHAAAVFQRWHTGCPDFASIERNDKAEKRSISPHGAIIDKDPSRFPRVLIHKACLCQHCYDPATGRPDENLVSYNLTTSINVSYKNGVRRKYQIITGCTCVLPRVHVMPR